MSEEKSIQEQIIEFYRTKVEEKYKDIVGAWPVLSGCNTNTGTFKNWLIVILTHTGVSHVKMNGGLGELTQAIVGVDEITLKNREQVRARISRHYRVGTHDGVLFLEKGENTWELHDEADILLKKHEYAMGVLPMRIFLSHKGADKPLVREFKSTLEMLGFSPWLDEDAMSAGAELERSILKGFEDSCAAIFFVTPNYKDENFLASEVDYAIQEKRKKGDKFSIITLVYQEEDCKGEVPALLHRYVWKQPENHLEALREILKALPIQTGDVYWKY